MCIDLFFLNLSLEKKNPALSVLLGNRPAITRVLTTTTVLGGYKVTTWQNPPMLTLLYG